MDTSTTNTLQQVNDAINAIDQASNDTTDPATAETLEKISDALENIKNDIISQTEGALVDAMSSDTTDLNNLVGQIDQADAQLDKVTGIIKTVSSAIGVLVNITTAGMSAGLL
ncbi:MAG TPA: hypothetical protein VIM16_02990 [Mucilaginibacter sp.]|jgi:cob(I)alamin adenosyltransferase